MDHKMLNILLVEDNLSHAEIITRCLKKCNQKHQIHHVDDGEKAINFLNHDQKEGVSPENHINLILLDLRIPKLDGMEVLKELKKRSDYRSIPVVVLTSSDAENDKVKAYENFANSYLVKPIGFDEFQSLIAHVDDYWSNCNHSIHLN